MTHDHAHHAPHDHKADARAAFTGLIVGAVFLLAVVFAIVKLTNAKFDRAHPPAAGAAH